jgi:hypothetical protein
MEKICPSCGKSLSLENFYKDRSKPDGYTSTCKSCRRKAQKFYRKTHKSSVKIYEDNRREQDERKKYSREYQRGYRHYNKIQSNKHDEKTQARKLINGLVRSNKLRKPLKCELTPSTENIQYHHTDYNYPYIVVALAHNVHEIVHKKTKYTKSEHDKVRLIVEKIGNLRKEYFNKHGLNNYLITFNNKGI